MTAPGLFHLQHVAQRKAEQEDQHARDQLLDGARGRYGARHDGHGVLPGIHFEAVEAAIHAVRGVAAAVEHHKRVAEGEVQRLGARVCLAAQFFAEVRLSASRWGSWSVRFLACPTIPNSRATSRYTSVEVDNMEQCSIMHIAPPQTQQGRPKHLARTDRVASPRSDSSRTLRKMRWP